MKSQGPQSTQYSSVPSSPPSRRFAAASRPLSPASPYLQHLPVPCLLTPCASCARLYYLVLLSPPVQKLDNPCWRGQLPIDYSLQPPVHHVEMEEALNSLKL